MTQKEAIVKVCAIVSLAHHSIGDYSEPSDCFCEKSPDCSNFQNSGKAINYVLKAVVNQLRNDGFEPDSYILEKIENE